MLSFDPIVAAAEFADELCATGDGSIAVILDLKVAHRQFYGSSRLSSMYMGRLQSGD